METGLRDRPDMGIAIRKGAILITALFVVLGLMLYNAGREFEWQLSLTAAGSAASVWITLEIVERAIKEDRDRQWEKVKSLTYMTIINDIRYIVTTVPLDSGDMWDRINLINGEINYPSKFTTNIILDIAKELQTEYDQIFAKHNQMLDELDEKELDRLDELDRLYRLRGDKLDENEFDKLYEYKKYDRAMHSLRGYCKSIEYLIQDMRTILIPRTLLLSTDPEVNLALTEFEAFTREFHEDLKTPDVFSGGYEPVVQLLKELAKLYDVLQSKMSSEKGNITYKFKEPEPLL